MSNFSSLPRFLVVFSSVDHRLAYSEKNVSNILRGVSVRYGRRALDGTSVLSLPGYEDVTNLFIGEGGSGAGPS